jgi:hypothetical protein
MYTEIPPQSLEASVLIIFILQMKKLRLREVNQNAQITQ